MDVCLSSVLYAVRQRSLRRTDHSSRSPTECGVSKWVWFCSLDNEEVLAHQGFSCQQIISKTFDRLIRGRNCERWTEIGVRKEVDIPLDIKFVWKNWRHLPEISVGHWSEICSHVIPTIKLQAKHSKDRPGLSTLYTVTLARRMTLHLPTPFRKEEVCLASPGFDSLLFSHTLSKQSSCYPFSGRTIMSLSYPHSISVCFMYFSN